MGMSQEKVCAHAQRMLEVQDEVVVSLWRGLSIEDNVGMLEDVALGRRDPIFFGVQAGALGNTLHDQGRRRQVREDLVTIYRSAGLLESNDTEGLIKCFA